MKSARLKGGGFNPEYGNKAYTLAKADLLQGIADSEGDSLNITQVSANHGSVKSGSANTWIFSPEASYRGPVSLSYTVSDGHGGAATFQQAFTLAAADGSQTSADAPVLTGLSFPETVNLAKGDTGFAVTATGSDDGGAILSAIVHFGRAFVLDDGAPYLESLVILDTWADGSARADLTMDSATLDGAYAIADLTLEDQQGHVATYSASELAGLGFSTSFTVTHKAGSPPVNTVPGARSFYQGTTQAFSVKVADADSASLTVTLAATHGTLSLARTTGLSFVQGDGKDDAGLKFSGSLANLNAALDGLSFKPESGYVGSASLKITSSDGAQSDSDSVALTVRPLPPGPGVSIVPQQTPAITTENNALVTGKPGGAATFSVSLKTQPDSDVVLKFASNDTTEGTLANPTLTFTHSNWSTPQILTVRGVDDLDNDGDTAYTVSGQVVSEDINYIRGVVIANLTLTNQDDPEDAPMTGYGDQNAPNYRDPWTGGNGADTYYAGRDIDFVHGGLGNDKLYGQEDDDKLWGEGGGDTLWGGYGADQLDGAGGNDKLYGEQDDDVLNGGDGDDLLDGGQGADQMSGGKGADTYYVDDKGDQVDDQGTDGAIDTVLIPVFLSYTLGASIENGTLTGADNSNLTGNGLANALSGNSGDNVLDGGAGNDKLVGGAGNDTLKGGSGLDTADYSAATAGVTASLTTNKASGGGQGNDSFSAIENLLGGLGNDALSGNTGSNSLMGGAGNDALNGGAGNDSLRGGFGSDTLKGGDGSDLIAGGVGKDSLTGGAGADRFVYSDISDTGLGSAARDVVADFSSADGDKLDLSAWDAKPGLAGIQHWSFVASFSGVPGQVRFDAASHLVLFDHNGDKQADFQVELTGVSALSASDFVLA